MRLKTIDPIEVSNPDFEGIASTVRSTFLYALAFFFIFLILTLAIPPRSYNFGYFGALKDKHHRLEILPSPKIVFVGGSNLAFGLDSNLVERTLHKPVVNMGLCAPFGLRYLLEEVKDNINNGDTIVIVPEYGILQNTVYGSTDLVHVLEVYPPAALYILRACISSPEYIYNLAKIAVELPAAKWNAFYTILDKMRKNVHFDPAFLSNWEIADPAGIPVRYYFNRRGDYFGHFEKPNRNYEPNWQLVKSMSSAAANILDDFNSFARQRGAQVVIIPPPIPSVYLTPDMCSPQVVANWPDKKISIPILASPRRYAFASSDFYELPYHLNYSGRNKRTTLLIEDLKRYLEKSDPNLVNQQRYANK